jgi:ParB/RepB/Spo0J family partition protein
VSRDTLLDLIDPDPQQPRTLIDEAGLQELAQSMLANGLAVPILIRPTPGGRYIIVHGERRFRAAKMLGWNTIPAEVRELSPDEARWLALIENVQRADLSPLDEAFAYQRRLAEGMTQAQLAQRIGKDRSYIAQKLRLLGLPEPLKVFLHHQALTEGHARQLLKLRQWFGADFTRTFHRCKDEDCWREDKVADSIGFMMVGFMPESRPDYMPLFFSATQGAEQRAIVAAAIAFLDDLSSENHTMPYWESYAFWWGVVAVIACLSVHALDKAMERWYTRIRSALVYWQWYGAHFGHTDPPEPEEDEEERRWYWGVWADLRHAGLLTLARQGLIPEALQSAAREFVVKEDSFFYPSEMQNQVPPELAKTWTTPAT